MIDPLFLPVLGAGWSVLVRLGAAAAEVWVLRGRARLTAAAARAPEGLELGGRGRDGATWYVRTAQREGGGRAR
ncbi:hypothetical protein [Streptomyces sp. NPDC094472]|uniref:hypothetical protein n=1 Tax=unclassified Streptomyces TaxID=2593676 RepID=UPI00331EC39F